VLIEDGGVVVLGGLIEDNSVKGEQRVPYLGSIPLIGLLFKTRNATSTKNNLIMFIRPKILRDQAQAAYETDLKYNYMRDQQKNLDSREVLPLLPNTTRGTLNPLPPPPPQPAEHVAPGQPIPAPSAAFPVVPPPANQPPVITSPPGAATATPAPDNAATPATTAPPGKP
jgi:general secretion pathway protein D